MDKRFNKHVPLFEEFTQGNYDIQGQEEIGKDEDNTISSLFGITAEDSDKDIEDKLKKFMPQIKEDVLERFKSRIKQEQEVEGLNNADYDESVVIDKFIDKYVSDDIKDKLEKEEDESILKELERKGFDVGDIKSCIEGNEYFMVIYDKRDKAVLLADCPVEHIAGSPDIEIDTNNIGIHSKVHISNLQ